MNVAGRALVIGLGSLHGGDDRVGLDVARSISAAQPDGVEVVEHADPTDLVELWTGRDRVVVVDALLAGEEPGVVRVIEAGVGEPSLAASRTWTSSGGTHAFGLSDAIALARTLGRLPRRLTVVGVVGRTFRPMDDMSPDVVRAIPVAVDTVLRSLAQDRSDVSG